MIDANTSLKEVASMEGVKDLPMVVRAKFAKALMLEARGEFGEAEKALNEAVEAEQRLVAA